MGISELVRPLFDSAKRAVSDDLVGRLDASRWTVLRLDLGGGVERILAGPVLGRRLVRQLGIVAVLALRDDGSYGIEVVPADEAPLSIDEAVARAALVLGHRRPAARGHAFQPSPVWPALCSVCGGGPLAHDRAFAEESVSKALGPRLESRVEFAPDSASVVKVEVRSVVTPAPLPSPTDDDVHPVVPRMPIPKMSSWRALTWSEERQLRDQVDASVKLLLVQHGAEAQP